MKKLITSFAFLSVCFLATSASAQSCNLSSLGDCLYNSGVTCRATVPGCTADKTAGQSVPDVELHATQTCCRYTGRNKKKKQSDCFKRIERGLGKSFQNAGPLRLFIKESKRSVTALRKAGCSTGSTS